MDLKNFYQKIGGSYEEIKARLPADRLIQKFVLMLPKDGCYSRLKDAMEKQDWQSAFSASHTLKGVAANLAMKTLYSSAAALTEDLRSGQPAPETGADYEKVRAAYEAVIAAIHEEEGGSS